MQLLLRGSGLRRIWFVCQQSGRGADEHDEDERRRTGRQKDAHTQRVAHMVLVSKHYRGVAPLIGQAAHRPPSIQHAAHAGTVTRGMHRVHLPCARGDEAGADSIMHVHLQAQTRQHIALGAT